MLCVYLQVFIQLIGEAPRFCNAEDEVCYYVDGSRGLLKLQSFRRLVICLCAEACRCETVFVSQTALATVISQSYCRICAFSLEAGSMRRLLSHRASVLLFRWTSFSLSSVNLPRRRCLHETTVATHGDVFVYIFYERLTCVCVFARVLANHRLESDERLRSRKVFVDIQLEGRDQFIDSRLMTIIYCQSLNESIYCSDSLVDAKKQCKSAWLCVQTEWK